MFGTKAATIIGPEGWRNFTYRGIKLSQITAKKSDKNCDIGRSLDPLPQLRDTVAQLSNEEIHRYVRDVRCVVARLRESLLETNDEVKSLTRGKDTLERSIEHTRKDIHLNKESQESRISRPAEEKEHDVADDLLNAERSHLLNCKKTLEAQLRSVQEHLHTLNYARKRLFSVLQERSRVLDLLCHALASIVNISKHQTLNGRSHTFHDGRLSQQGPSVSDPLGSFTPEAEHALADAHDARGRSMYLRKELNEAVEKTESLTRAAHKSVNDGMTQKVLETVTLKQHLTVSLGENRHAVHRAQCWYDLTDQARGCIMGPVSSAQLTTRERLDRPLVHVFQRHPGTQLPEAQQIIESGDSLLQSLAATSRNIGLLQLAGLHLSNDIRNKNAAASIDGAIIQLRRRKSNYKWTLGGAF